MTAVFTDVHGSVYIIAHGVTCQEICKCSPSEVGGIFGPITMALHCGTKVAHVPGIVFVDRIEPNGLKVYPNPFRDEVFFEFVSGTDAHAMLEVYNLTGQKVVTLMDRMVIEGVLNKVSFKPVEQVSGMYLYRLKLDDSVFTGRVIYNGEE